MPNLVEDTQVDEGDCPVNDLNATVNDVPITIRNRVGS